VRSSHDLYPQNTSSYSYVTLSKKVSPKDLMTCGTHLHKTERGEQLRIPVISTQSEATIQEETPKSRYHCIDEGPAAPNHRKMGATEILDFKTT